MDAQQEQDLALSKPRAEPKPELFDKLVQSGSSRAAKRSSMRDPVAAMLANHPGLSLEKALQHAEDFGFLAPESPESSS